MEHLPVGAARNTALNKTEYGDKWYRPDRPEINFQALARRLADLDTSRTIAPEVDALFIRTLIAVRRAREAFFADGMFADPGWDILLDLTAARLEGRTVSVSSLCIAASVPTTTGLRWIRDMTAAGMLERRNDPTDARRHFICLPDAVYRTMLTCLARISGLLAVNAAASRRKS